MDFLFQTLYGGVILCCSYYTYMQGNFWTALTKNCLNVTSRKENLLSSKCHWNIVDRSICHFINEKFFGRDNRQFIFDILKIEKTKELLATSKFCTFELIEKSILLKRLS